MEDKIQHSKPVPPFVRFCAANIPMVFDDSLSYYECLCALWKWLQTDVINVINNNASVTEHYIELDLETRQLFIQLKEYVDNYFANLDVQEEINNKLDQMAEAGELGELLVPYLNATCLWCYDTVSDMQSAQNLVNGSYAKTLGYYSKNEGGGAYYKITNSNDVSDGGSVIDISTGVQAHLQKNEDGSINVRQFGAKGDGSTEDTTALQNAIDYAVDNSCVLYIPEGEYITDALNVNGHIKITGENWEVSVLKAKDLASSTTGIINVYNDALQQSRIENLTLLGNKENQSNSFAGIYLYATESKDYRTVLTNLFIRFFTGDGVYIGGTVGSYSIREIKLDKVTVNACERNGINVASSSDSFWNNIVCSSCRLNGMLFSGSGNHKISNSKMFYNGRGDEVTQEPSWRLFPAYTLTEDSAPVQGVTYYTNNNTDISPYAIPNYVQFTGTEFVEGTKYYTRDNDDYSKRYAGICLDGAHGIAMSVIECQDNWGDGIYLNNSNHIVISSYLGDRNGLLLDDNGRASYEDENKTQIYYALTSYGSMFVNLQESALDTNNHLSQRGSLFLVNTGRTDASIVSANQIEDVCIKMTNTGTVNYHRFNIILNGETYSVDIDLSKLTMNNSWHIEDDTTQLKSYIRRSGNRVYISLMLTREGGTPTTDNQLTSKIMNALPVGFRAYNQTHIPITAFTNDFNRATVNVDGDVDTYGNVEFRVNSALATSYSKAVFQGEYQVKL